MNLNIPLGKCPVGLDQNSVYSKYSGLMNAIKHYPKQVSCPFSHQGKTKFRLYPDWNETGGGYHEDYLSLPGGIDVIALMENCTKGEALNIIIDICGGKLESISKKIIQKVSTKTTGISSKEKQDRRAKLCKIQSNAKSASASLPVHVYLRGRGLKGDMSKLPKALGYAKELWWGDGESKPRKACGMLGLLTDVNNKPVSIHRTFLNPSHFGKLEVSTPKMLMKAPIGIKGCSIKLDQPKSFMGEVVIGLAEGLETCLAVREAVSFPMWSTISATLMKGVQIPKHVTCVFIFADKDRKGVYPSKGEAGQIAANELAERLRSEGKKVYILLPDGDIPDRKNSIDWDDVYVQHGPEAFPCLNAELLDTGFTKD
ncbi:toprim domain-containing protein (plasmid) [Psychrobium sp. nBUS_13]|uniref:toprim domain-containing protein n=1 Tax=Psychrobium sp. nBUS_13 TaxID=3395319 RepID=UPI003EBA910E